MLAVERYGQHRIISINRIAAQTFGVWGLAMNSLSTHKEEVWQFMQYFTSKEFLLWGAVTRKMVDPPRMSIFSDQTFLTLMKDAPGYPGTFHKTDPGTHVFFYSSC